MSVKRITTGVDVGTADEAVGSWISACIGPVLPRRVTKLKRGMANANESRLRTRRGEGKGRAKVGGELLLLKRRVLGWDDDSGRWWRRRVRASVSAQAKDGVALLPSTASHGRGHFSREVIHRDTCMACRNFVYAVLYSTRLFPCYLTDRLLHQVPEVPFYTPSAPTAAQVKRATRTCCLPSGYSYLLAGLHSGTERHFITPSHRNFALNLFA